MSMNSLGDLAQFSQSLRQTTAIKSRMATLGQELSSGRIADLNASTGGSNASLTQTNRELDVIKGYLRTGADLEQRLSRMQLVLGEVESHRSTITNDMALAVGSGAYQQDEISQRARDAMSSVVGKINLDYNGAALFSGRATDAASLIPAEDMLADISLTLTAASSAADIKTAVDDWFDGPTGFATIGYTGDTGAPLTRRVSATENLTLDARADDPGVKDTLKGLAMAAMADVLGVPENVRADVLRDSMDALFAAGGSSVALRARVGDQEAQLARATVSHQLQDTLLSSDKNNRVQADPFETASLLQEVQRQLELHFTSTARLSRLSLVNFL